MASVQSSSSLVLVLDASGSMWEQIQGGNKIVIARRVLKDLVNKLPASAEVGLIAYGHRRKGDCDDIETVVPLGRMDKSSLGQQIDALNPTGMTPITSAIKKAFEMVRSQEGAATIVLVSDGLETCGGDPCQTVRDAKKAGIDFVMHVVGFDVGKVDVSQLECAAQAGGGLYLNARNADELAAALNQAVAAPAELPGGHLSVKAVADGALTDVIVRVVRAGTRDEVASGRTYKAPETNPRIMPLPEGTYDVEVQAIGFKGDIRQQFKGVRIANGQMVEKVADFGTGELAVEVTRNGALSDATVTVYAAGTREQVAGGRSYRSSGSNPKVFRLTPGQYDVVVKSVEIAGGPEERLTGVVVESGGEVKRAVKFQSGTLRIGAVQGGQLVDATVNVVSLTTGQSIASGRTYTNANSNPRAFELPPGQYRVTLRAVRLPGRPSRELQVTVQAGQTIDRTVDFAQ